MSTKGDHEDEEETGPSVDSADPEERIEARRQRISRRLEAQKRAQLGDRLGEHTEIEEALSRSRKQMNESRLRLQKLLSDGWELVSNIRVAGDAREGARRIEEEEARRLRKERQEAEAKAGAEKFDDITKKWESALQKEIPQDLYGMLQQQKESCDHMIEEKNKLISEFQMELKQKDDHYVKDLKKQSEDIDLLIERMDEQVKQLTGAYRQELNQIEKAFVVERNELLEKHMKTWEYYMTMRRDKEIEYMKSREKRVEDYEKRLQQLRIQDAEEYNTVKIKLETDVQILEQQLQQMRATYQLNQEKLEYNFQVLRKRDEENTITKSQQKRKITRLQDVLTNLKLKLGKQEKQYRDENQQLTEDYKRITEQFKELQKKSKHFITTDAKKFHDIWLMNEEEAKVLANKVLEEDRIIFEQQLGLQWSTPELPFLENVGPVKADLMKKKSISAQQVLQEVLAPQSAKQTQDPETSEKVYDKTESLKSQLLQKFSPRLVKQILELLCDESGFLIESKLNKLLQPLEKDEQSLMRLDAIFSALGVETEDDIQNLAQYFLMLAGRGETDALQQSIATQSQQPTEPEEEEVDEEVAKVTGPADSQASDLEEQTPRSIVEEQDLIHPNDVLKALRSFVQDNRQPPKEKTRAAQFKMTGLEDRDDSQDSMYWASYMNVLPESKQRLMSALVDGLEKYSETLNSRATLINETNGLQQQNAELRMLLHQYVNSRVNQELEIPPTRVLQLEMNSMH